MKRLVTILAILISLAGCCPQHHGRAPQWQERANRIIANRQAAAHRQAWSRLSAEQQYHSRLLAVYLVLYHAELNLLERAHAERDIDIYEQFVAARQRLWLILFARPPPN